jgi:hypothetical protein
MLQDPIANAFFALIALGLSLVAWRSKISVGHKIEDARRNGLIVTEARTRYTSGGGGYRTSSAETYWVDVGTNKHAKQLLSAYAGWRGLVIVSLVIAGVEIIRLPFLIWGSWFYTDWLPKAVITFVCWGVPLTLAICALVGVLKFIYSVIRAIINMFRHH